MARREKPPREKAARALCELDGHAPETRFEGGPMWASYLPQVDAVLRAALGADAWRAMVDTEAPGT
ncbi:hypothetical protein HOY34_17285 [Xinfangfangia sp. D13-10-4-6]|uniref:hypothetical protein n=1 Tax=Pseudogemmobacter hezensis TaxID=2737662 RepID=UPI0015567AD5|nr:hypothetical protein [Pseudogemmobacter hezensis]NPD16949.1 hypothetical protein [Pseudogemmobacter hezensis]